MVAVYKMEVIEKNHGLTWNEEGLMDNGFVRLLRETSIKKANKSFKGLFHDFKQYTIKYSFEKLNFEKTFLENGLLLSDYTLTSVEPSTKSANEYIEIAYSFVHNEDESNEFVLFASDILIDKIIDEALIFEEIDFFREDDETFVKFALLDEFKEDGTYHESSLLYVTNNEVLNNIKKYFSEDSKIQSWSLKDKEVVYFSL